MRLAVMQPYFFPYLGYFQLIHAVDRFVFYDDVAFIKGGWINRNRMLLDGKPHYFCVALANQSSFRPIKDVAILTHNTRWKRKLLSMFHLAYRDKPGASEGLGLLEDALDREVDTIAALARHSVTSVLSYLGSQTQIIQTSQVYENAELKGQARILDICKREGARTYVNSPGGRELYRDSEFSEAGIELRFINGRLPEYPQGKHPFVPGLSILDIIMHCTRAQVRDMVAQYEIVRTPMIGAPGNA